MRLALAILAAFMLLGAHLGTCHKPDEAQVGDCYVVTDGMLPEFDYEYIDSVRTVNIYMKRACHED